MSLGFYWRYALPWKSKPFLFIIVLLMPSRWNTSRQNFQHFVDAEVLL
jgi:hypothetical protein